MKLGILAGEASGDVLGAGLIKELQVSIPNLKVTGMGGPVMAKTGFQSLFDIERLAVIGLIEPLLRLHDLLKLRRDIIQHFTQNKPDVFVGIDSPDFNLGIELKLRKMGIPVIHYVSPTVWAWRQKRIHKIAKATDLVLTLFPFEADFYHRHQVPVKFVGHPLADRIPLTPNKSAARKKLWLDEDVTYIALLPGSRKHELKYMAETFINAAKVSFQKNSQLKFISSAANDLRDQEFKALCQKLAPDLPIQFYVGNSHDVMEASDIVLVASGTATLETMLFKKPMVIVCKLGKITFQIAKRIVNTKFIGLPNLLAQEELVPEFIQDAAQPQAIAAALLTYLEHPEKMHAVEDKFMQIHLQLRQNASQQAALAVQSLLSKA